MPFLEDVVGYIERSPISPVRKQARTVQLVRNDLAVAQREAAAAREAYLAAADTTRTLRDQQAALEARRDTLHAQLRALVGPAVLEGKTGDKGEAAIEREIDRLDLAIANLAQDRIPAALAADIRVGWQAEAAQTKARDLTDRLAGEEARLHDSGYFSGGDTIATMQEYHAALAELERTAK
jgi:hypothetical protein